MSHRRTGRARAPLAFLAALAGGQALAAPVAPWPTQNCQNLAQDITAATSIPVTVTTGDARSQDKSAPAGTACLLFGKKSGLTQTWAGASQRLGSLLKDWQQIPEFAADGPDSSVVGYRKGNREVILQFEHAPPKGTCKRVVQSACKIPPQRWTWTVHATAYDK